jgi:phosphatidylinositol alpha-1,6-mannosyltransferase
MDSLGLFPAISGDATGGVEAAGRIAWECVRGQSPSGAYLISYGPSQAESEDETSFRCGSQSKAARKAATLALRCRRALAWHLGLSPLLALARPIPGGSAVFLHGVEAWRPLRATQRAALTLTRPLLLANSEETKRRFLTANEWARGLRATVVPLGIGSPVAAGDPPSGPPAAVMVGRLHRDEGYKGHREVISAWPRVVAQLPQAELWIIGDGNLRSELEDLVRSLNLGPRVRFLGRVSDAERDQRIVQARCLALPSRGEGFGLVYVEAMRSGRPCLVGNVDAGREVVAPPAAGLAVDPGDAAAVAGALIRLLSAGEEWTTWSRQAKRRYEAFYTEQHFRQRFAEAWATLH